MGRGGGGFSGGGGGFRGGGGSFGGSRGGGGRSGGSFGGGRGGSSSFGGGLFGGSSNRSGGSYTRPSGGGNSFGSSFFGAYLGSRMGGGSPRPSGGNNNGPSGGGNAGCGCGTALIILVVIAIVVAVLFSFNSGGSDIAKSTVAREPLPKNSVIETEYYTDELGWISSKTAMTSGLKHFYDKTGVQPYVYITDQVYGSNYPSSGDLQNYANDLYDELFKDEAHLLLVFFEYNPSQYMDYYVTGTQAKTVIDSEAGDILLDYIDKYYYSDLSEDEFFSKSFSDAADRIMEVTKSPWIPVLAVLGIIVVVLLLFSWWKHAKKQKNLEAKQTEEILNTPIEKFSDSEAETLRKKYDDKDSN